jgi:hypothetical protein
VGIGTASPAARLDINTTASGNILNVQGTAGNSAEINISLTSGTGNKECILNFGNNLGTAGRYIGRIFYQTDNNVMGFWTNTTERMRIDSSGNVGIGTTSPSTYGKLAVAGAIAPIGAVGTSSIDVAGAATTVASGGTVNFPNASGMLVVNQHNTGGVTIYLCGGGSAGVVANIISQVGTFAYNSGIAGYTWTSSSTCDYGFFFVRTRPTA